MKTLTSFTAMIFLAFPVAGLADDIIQIEVGHDYKNYSDSELRRRVWELERAVSQLQRRVFDLESSKTAPPTADTWVCKVTAMSDVFQGTGGSKAVAKKNAMDRCKAASSNYGFFCKDADCEQ